MTEPVTAIPALAPVVRPVSGVDEGCGKAVTISGEVLDEESVMGLKEVDAGKSIFENSVNGSRELDAGEVVVEA